MKNLLFYLLTINSIFSIAQNVGINQANPKATLDINGNIILARGPMILSNGITFDIDINTNRFSVYEVTGPTANFSIGGLNGVEDGRILILYNATGFSMNLLDQNNPTSANQITTGNSTNLSIISKSTVVLRYSTSNNKWNIVSVFNPGNCPPGMVACNGKCVNITNDAQNCGACGNICPSGFWCINGGCVVNCGSGLTNCNNTCKNLLDDPQNCGACGVCCPPGYKCTNGTCVLVCPPGLTNCGGTCVLLNLDVNNCGACGVICPSGTWCINGVCTVNCSSGLTDCSGVCINTMTNISNCGACGAVCPPLANATTTCIGGVCSIATCNAGFANCDGITSNGCEVNLTISATNCGSCGTVCPALANATTTCIGGVCSIATCNAGFANCDGITFNGCEVNLTSTSNCGTCGNVCTTGTICNGTGCIPNPGLNDKKEKNSKGNNPD